MSTAVTHVISATVKSTDNTRMTRFDALAWFSQATNDDLLDLVDCYFTDQPADHVAEYAARQNAEVKAVLQYVADHNDNLVAGEESRDICCCIDETDAMAWMQQNRHKVYDQIMDRNGFYYSDNNVHYWLHYDTIREAAKCTMHDTAAGPVTFKMTLVKPNEIEVVMEVVHDGVDERSEACYVPDRGDWYEANATVAGGPVVQLQCAVSVDSLCVLLRRLTGFDTRRVTLALAAERLALTILELIGIEDGQYIGPTVEGDGA